MKTSTNKETGKKVFFVETRKQRRYIPILLPKVADSEKNTKKSERKRRNRLVKKKAQQKKEKTQGWKNKRKTMKKAEKKE